MENTSKALLMAAEVLIGVLIISVGVYLFTSFGDYSKDMNAKMESAQIDQFNNQFLKYTGEYTDQSGNIVPIKVTLHDIVSLANLAKKHNEEYELTESDYDDEGTKPYIRIDIGNTRNIEQYSAEEIINLLKNNSLDDVTTEIRYYKCLIDNYHVSEHTRLVNYMKFVEI